MCINFYLIPCSQLSLQFNLKESTARLINELVTVPSLSGFLGLFINNIENDHHQQSNDAKERIPFPLLHSLSSLFVTFWNFKIANIKITKHMSYSIVWVGGQHLERLNVERPIFRNFEFSNIKMTKVELFDFSILEFFKKFTIKFELWGILIVLQIVKFWKFDNFRNWTISEFWLFYELFDNGNLENFWNFFFQFGKIKFDSENWQILELFVHSVFRTDPKFANPHISSLKF